MAFVRTKKVKGGEYYQLVESRRIDGKPRQKVLVYLDGHPTVDDALKKWPREIKRLRRDAAKERESAESWPEASRHYRDKVRQAASWEKRASNLEMNLRKLLELRKRGAA